MGWLGDIFFFFFLSEDDVIFKRSCGRTKDEKQKLRKQEKKKFFSRKNMELWDIQNRLYVYIYIYDLLENDVGKLVDFSLLFFFFTKSDCGGVGQGLSLRR